MRHNFLDLKKRNCQPKCITQINICCLLFKLVLHELTLSKEKYAKGAKTKASSSFSTE